MPGLSRRQRLGAKPGSTPTRHHILATTLGEVLGVNSPTKGWGNVLHGKGGFWVKGKGFYTIAQARRLTGIKAPARERRQTVQPWGDYATIAMLNQPRKPKKI